LTVGYNSSHTNVMKTAISLPDAVFKAGERHAARLRISRSQLYATALEEYLARHSDDAITERLNAVYGEEPSTLDPILHSMQARSIQGESWK
jgi:metal-responsive CopG/Arc/MetJ family transcriptional regulator